MGPPCKQESAVCVRTQTKAGPQCILPLLSNPEAGPPVLTECDLPPCVSRTMWQSDKSHVALPLS